MGTLVSLLFTVTKKTDIRNTYAHVYVLFLPSSVKKAIVVCGKGDVPYVRISSFCFYPENKRPITNTETIPGVVL